MNYIEKFPEHNVECKKKKKANCRTTTENKRLLIRGVLYFFSFYLFFYNNLMGDKGKEDRGQKHKSQFGGLLKQSRGETN